MKKNLSKKFPKDVKRGWKRIMSSKLSIVDGLTMPVTLLGAVFQGLEGRPIGGEYKKSHVLSLDFYQKF